MNQEILQLELTVEEVNLILDALGDRPFKTVFSIISKIQQQAGEQLQAELGTTTPPPSAPTDQA